MNVQIIGADIELTYAIVVKLGEMFLIIWLTGKT